VLDGKRLKPSLRGPLWRLEPLCPRDLASDCLRFEDGHAWAAHPYRFVLHIK